jgi:hypothetical protein
VGSGVLSEIPACDEQPHANPLVTETEKQAEVSKTISHPMSRIAPRFDLKFHADTTLNSDEQAKPHSVVS